MKFIDTLTNQIDETNNTKYYWLKSYKRDLKKSDRKYNKFKWKKIININNINLKIKKTIFLNK